MKVKVVTKKGVLVTETDGDNRENGSWFREEQRKGVLVTEADGDDRENQ